MQQVEHADGRLYDASLVGRIRERVYTGEVYGVETLFKPVPDVDEEHVVDPRLETVMEKKRKMFSERAQTGWRLSNERYRPDKVTYDLTTTDVGVDERLIPIDDDHLIDIYIYRAEGAPQNCPVMIYLHGGGFTAGDMRLYANQMKLVAELSGAVAIFPEYRLAPECPFPGPIDDAWGTVCWVHEHVAELGVDPEGIMVAGDSAGGSLTAACVQRDLERMASGAERIIKKIVGIYPGWDLRDWRTLDEYTWSYDEYPVREDQFELVKSRIERIRSGVEGSETSSSNLYLQGKTTPDNPLVNVAAASDEVLEQFPEVLAISSEYDYLRVGTDHLVKRMQDLGVKVRNMHYCGCDHGFFDMLGTYVQAEELCQTLADELKAL